MIQPEIQQFIELIDTVDKLKITLKDVNEYFDHQTNGTINAYYKEVLNNFAVDLMVVPIDRFTNGLPEIDDPDEISEVIEQASRLIAYTFDKSHQQIKDDLNVCVENLPIKDFREARLRRTQGMLH